MLEVLGGRGPDVRSRRSSAGRSLAGEPLLSPDLPRIGAARSLLGFALHRLALALVMLLSSRCF